MRRSDRQPCFCYRLAAVIMLAHLLAVLALEASPRLHQWVHPDAGDDDHDCAVVLFIHGGGDQAPLPVVLPVCIYNSWREVSLVEPSPIWVVGVFAVNGILEHAPPPVGRA